jgi:hypothetical protein
MAGSLFWMAAARSVPDYDGTTVYLAAAPGQPIDPSAAAIAHAAQTQIPPGRHPGHVDL